MGKSCRSKIKLPGIASWCADCARAKIRMPEYVSYIYVQLYIVLVRTCAPLYILAIFLPNMYMLTNTVWTSLYCSALFADSTKLDRSLLQRLPVIFSACRRNWVSATQCARLHSERPDAELQHRAPSQRARVRGAHISQPDIAHLNSNLFLDRSMRTNARYVHIHK